MAADPQLVTLFARGWAMTRGLPPPEPRHGSHYIFVGKPDQEARYIFAALDAATIGTLSRRIRKPWIYFKICEHPDAVRAVLPPHWAIRQPPSWIMTKMLAPANARLPEGYTLRIGDDGEILRASVHYEDEAVARGRIALLGETALFDQISTDEPHRRKGLGRTLMQVLSNAAIDQRAPKGLLSATEMGRWLYQSIGWSVHSPYTSAVIPG
jgi:GNAT superfamily N-acetyltransferase